MAGVRKAAILLVQIGKEQAAPGARPPRETEVEAISAEIARLDTIDADETDDVLDEFRDLLTARTHVAQGGLRYARELLETSLGPERAAEILDRLNAAAIADAVPVPAPRRPARSCSPSSPTSTRRRSRWCWRTCPPTRPRCCCPGSPPEQQADVAHRIAVMDRTSPDDHPAGRGGAGAQAVLGAAADRAVHASAAWTRWSSIINRSDRTTERLIVEGLEALDPELAEEVRRRMFMFEDIVSLDDRVGAAGAAPGRDRPTSPLALKGVSEAVRDKVTGNLSERAAENLLEEIELLGPVRLTQVEEAQQGVVRIIRQLEESGQIMIRRGSDDEFVA